MKTKFYKYIPLVIGFVMALSACSDDDSDDPVPPSTSPKPVINVTIDGEQNEDSYTVGQGQGVTININALSASGGGANLDKIRILQNGDNLNATDFEFVSGETNTYDFSTNADQDIKNAEDKNLTLTGTFSDITTNVGTTTYTITVTDDDGVTNSREFDIVVFTSFSTTETGKIYHISGSLPGSWNLTTDTTVSAGNASVMADITNTDAATSAFTGSFKIGDTKALATKLVRVPANGYDYDRGSMQEAQDVYDAGTEITSISNPAADDMYIFNNSLGDLTVVKITSVEPTNDDCTCQNKGKMEFEYKK